ncbi:N6-methyladenosine-containing RNA reader [Malassezia pachydermatis]
MQLDCQNSREKSVNSSTSAQYTGAACNESTDAQKPSTQQADNASIGSTSRDKSTDGSNRIRQNSKDTSGSPVPGRRGERGSRLRRHGSAVYSSSTHPNPTSPDATNYSLYDHGYQHPASGEFPYNRYYYYGYYPNDQPMGYPPPLPSDTASYSRSDDSASGDKEELSTSPTDMGGGHSAMLAPMPMGVYYSMPFYQRPICYPNPSNTPMVGYPYNPSMQGAISPGYVTEGEPLSFPADGIPPSPSYGYEPRSPHEPVYINGASSMYRAIPSPPGGDAYRPFIYHDSRPYFSYSPSGPPIPGTPLMRPGVPMPPGYPMSQYEWTSYAENPSMMQRMSSTIGRRRRSTPSQRRRSSISTSPENPTPRKPEEKGASLKTSPSLKPTLEPTATAYAGRKDADEQVPQEEESTTKTNGAMSENQRQGTRSNYVMWCGNVPSDATLEELWSFFSSIPEEITDVAAKDQASKASDTPELGENVNSAGILSIFIISRSSCAFVNYASQEALSRACSYFHGMPLRTKPSCPRLVCRPRKLEDAEYAGVAAQRGKGVHTNWYRQQIAAQRDAARSADDKNEELDMEDARSFSSTNSSLLRQPLFANRFFILKSRSSEALETALRTNIWSTQPHNEPVLDQAFRNSESVTLLFSENFSGQFFGYAVMASRPGGALATEDVISSLISRTNSPSLQPDEVPSAEPGLDSESTTLTGERQEMASRPNQDGINESSAASTVSETPSLRAERQTEKELALEAQARNLQLDHQSDTSEAEGQGTATTGSSSEPLGSSIHEPRSLQVGQPFYIDWRIASPLPFSEIQGLRNPWRDNRLIKVSRDGTEIEPNVGKMLLKAWEMYLSKEDK